MRLEVTSLTVGYGDHPVLEDLSFQYESPGILSLLGTNGTGKSTLLKTLLGELTPQSGTIHLDGKPLTDYSARELAQKMAYIAQSHYPVFPFRVLDVVMMGSTAKMGIFSTPGVAEQKLALEKLSFLGMEALKDKPYTDLSGGERQLVMIASALAQEPEVLILDEPTAHLDFGNQARFIRLVEQLHREGMGILMTTHFPDHALTLGGETAILHGGHLLAQGPAQDLIVPEQMEALYGIPVDRITHRGREFCLPML